MTPALDPQLLPAERRAAILHQGQRLGLWEWLARDGDDYLIVRDGKPWRVPEEAVEGLMFEFFMGLPPTHEGTS